MNYSLYLFGTNKGTYLQYPLDVEEAFLRPLCYSVKDTQLTVHRKKALTYYVFLKELASGSSQVFGMCLVTNGVCIENIKTLYRTFENIFSRIVLSDKILRLSETGRISYVSDNSVFDKADVEQTELLVREIVKEDLEPYAVYTDYNFYGSIATKTIALEERNSEILKAIEENNLVHIYSNDNCNTPISYIEQTISNLHRENSQLRADYNKLQSQKKQYRNVILLIFAVFGCGVGLFLLNASLGDAKNELLSTKSEIGELNGKVSNLSEELDNTKASLKITCEERDEAQQKMNDLKELVGSSMPIIITDVQIANTNSNDEIETDYGNTIYSSNTMYLKPKISYTGIRTGENIDLNVKLYTPSGMSTGSSSPHGYSYSTSIYVYSGENTATLSGWGGALRGYWSSGTYRFEIWYNNVCLRARSFTIY